jgi:pyruvate/2-oxoglutarate dehydrogenase complex dihydrolipoamide dehydrogenase (E3) component
MYDVIIVGGGPAGVTAALRARELGARVALVERDRLGGICTNDGCVPTRVLAHAARLIRDSEQFSSYGLSAQPPALNFERLMARVQEVVEQVHEKKQLANLLRDSEVNLYAGIGPARFVDQHTIRVGAELELQAEKFVLAVGGHARRINFPGAEYTLTHSDIWSLKTLPRSLVIVGGAATGCQLASVFAAFGSQVTLLEVSPRLLALEDEMISAAVHKSFEERGIRIITGIQGVDRVEKHGDVLRFFYKHEEAVKSIETEAVAMAVGWPGNIEQLNLEAVGIKTERNYVLVDD